MVNPKPNETPMIMRRLWPDPRLGYIADVSLRDCRFPPDSPSIILPTNNYARGFGRCIASPSRINPSNDPNWL